MNSQLLNRMLVAGPILVVGDGIMDNFLTKLSPKDCAEGVDCFEVRSEIFGGGALNVASNIEAFGGVVKDFCPIVDEKIRICSADVGVECRLDPVNTQKTLLGADWQTTFATELMDYIGTNWTPTIVIADYAKGVVTQDVIDIIANSNAKQIFIDTKRSPQEFMSIVNNYGRTCAFLPNMQEYELYTTLYDSLPVVVRTESQNGVTLLEEGKSVMHLPAAVSADKVVSVSGAGDTVTAAVAVGRSMEIGWDKVLRMAMAAAGYVVTCKYTGTVPDGRRFLERYFLPF